VTDRPCGMEQRCKDLGLTNVRIEETDSNRFSDKAGEVLVDQHGVDLVILYFHRILYAGLLERVVTLNIHPALLPSFKGLSPLKDVVAAGAKVFGATLHLATLEVDAGPMLAQVFQPTPDPPTPETLARMSFMQKCALTMLACEALMSDRFAFDLTVPSAKLISNRQAQGSLSPTLETEPYRQAFDAIQQRQGVPGPKVIL
nr:hypothetical protein [Phycisphaeraceae bacterium]